MPSYWQHTFERQHQDLQDQMGAYEWLTGSTPKRSLDNGALLVSGAYPRKGPKVKQVEDFAFHLGRMVAEREASIVSGNGPTVGNALVNGVQSVKKNEVFQYVCIIPFKQHGTVAEMTHAERSEYFHRVRQELISKANIVVVISGEKLASDGELINSETVMTEVSQATENGRFPIPVAVFGGAGAVIHAKLLAEINSRQHPYRDLPAGLFDKLANAKLSTSEILDAVFDITAWIIEHKLKPRSRRSSVSSTHSSHHNRTFSGASSSGANAELPFRQAPNSKSASSAAVSRQVSYASASVNNA